MYKTLSAHDYFEAQYVLRTSLPSFAADVAQWEALSADAHFTAHSPRIAHYGPHPRQTLELFKAVPGVPGKGLAVFIHGGFWRAMQREQSRFMATPFLARGYDCAILEYRLMPEFRMRDLVDDTLAGLRYLYENAGEFALAGHMVIAGHSAGAHLAVHAAMEAQAAGIGLRDAGLILISGVYDIHSIHPTSLGGEIQPTPEEVTRWSITSGATLAGRKAVFVAGGAETDGFIRQTLFGAQQLAPRGQDEVILVEGANHLTVLLAFARDDALCDAILSRL